MGKIEQESKEILSSEDTERRIWQIWWKDVQNELICKHTKPIARWLQRVIMWNTGLDAEFFIDKYDKP